MADHTADYAADYADVPDELVARLRTMCLALPDAYEERAWVGARWRIRGRTFAHVLPVDDEWPPVYSRTTGADGPVNVLTFRAPGDELDALVSSGHPFYRASWGANTVVMVLEDGVDWEEVAELLTESYCLQAPKKLVAMVARPGV